METALLEQVEDFIERHRLLPNGSRVLVAVSGGLDSMVLLCLLQCLAPRHRWRLAVAHFNHQLRGRESSADAEWVAHQARRSGLRCFVGRGCVRETARTAGVSLEMAARRLRHEFLATRARQHAASRIALGHHADDQVELFFLRLLRGSGPEGLAGMKPLGASPADRRIRLIRPLLGFSRRQLEAYARDVGLDYRQDASNSSREILRNRIRHELLPLLRERYQPGLDAVVLRAMQLLAAESELVAAQARRWLAASRPEAFAKLPAGLQRRILRLQFDSAGLEPGFDWVELLRSHPDRPLSIAAGKSVACQPAGRLRIHSPAPLSFQSGERRTVLERAHGHVSFAGRQFRWRRIQLLKHRQPLPTHRQGREFFDADRVGREVVLRHWRAGDRFQPLGMNQPAKLQNLLVNAKIPRAERRKLVVAATPNGELFWVEGLPPGERFKVLESTRCRLQWEWGRGEA